MSEIVFFALNIIDSILGTVGPLVQQLQSLIIIVGLLFIGIWAVMQILPRPNFKKALGYLSFGTYNQGRRRRRRRGRYRRY